MENKVEVLKFSLDTCAPCKVLSKTLEGIEGIIEIKDKETFFQYGVRAVPTLIFFKNGEEVNRVRGNISLEMYNELIKELE